MKFKCSECGTEFDVKPDYCDCGNDIFIEIDDIHQQEDILPEEKKEIPKISAKPLKNKETPKAQLTKKKKKKNLTVNDIISFLIFFLCLIFSGLVITMKLDLSSNPKEGQKEISKSDINIKEIPSIDDIWKVEQISIKNEEKQENSPALQKEEVKEPVNVLSNIFSPIKKTVAIKSNTTTKTTGTSPSKSANTTSASKKTQSSTKATTVTKTSSQTTSNPASGIDLQKILKNASSKVNSSSNQTSIATPKTSSAATSTQSKTVVTTPTKTSTVSTTPTTKTSATSSVATKTSTNTTNSVVQKQALSNYKLGLRNTIGNKINFSNVVGDGTCTVAFKVSSSGQLVNRSFSVQSSNITLNDAVYAAIMSTPSYSAPPSGYNNETMYLKISFYNGNFSISLN